MGHVHCLTPGTWPVFSQKNVNFGSHSRHQLAPKQRRANMNPNPLEKETFTLVTASHRLPVEVIH